MPVFRHNFVFLGEYLIKIIDYIALVRYGYDPAFASKIIIDNVFGKRTVPYLYEHLGDAVYLPFVDLFLDLFRKVKIFHIRSVRDYYIIDRFSTFFRR